MAAKRCQPIYLTAAKRRMLVQLLDFAIAGCERAAECRLANNMIDCTDLQRKVAAYRGLIDDLNPATPARGRDEER